MKINSNNKIILINELLLERFGIPKRNKKLPDPVDLLIATILSQNTNDTNSYKAYQNLRKHFPNWDMLINIPIDLLENEIRTAGLAKQKANAIKEFIVKIYETKKKINLNYMSGMKNEDAITELTRFNGIGVKTASCVLLFSFDRDVCPVDTHVHRTLNRIGIVKTSSPNKTFFELNKNFPENIAHSFHTNLIRLGREVCKSKNPSCGDCPIVDICQFNYKNIENKVKFKKKDFMLLDNVR